VFIVVFVGVALIFNGENTIDWISNTWNSWSK
jgi:Flp pilus assembly pilin Flp